MDAVAGALAGLDPADRPQLLRWVSARALLGLAHESSFADAASLAHRYANILAGGAR